MYLEFQNEIDETMFLAQQKAELCLGDSYVPRKVLVSNSFNTHLFYHIWKYS